MQYFIPLALCLSLSLADELWGGLDDWDFDDYLYKGYGPTGFLGGSRGTSTSYPRLPRYWRGGSGLRSTGSLGFSRGNLYSGFGGYRGYAGYGSYGNGYGSNILTTGFLGISSARQSIGRTNQFSSIPVTRQSNNILGVGRFRDDDDDDDDFNVRILGPGAVRSPTVNTWMRPFVPTYQQTTSDVRPIGNVGGSTLNVRPSNNNGATVINRGIMGASSTTDGDGKAAIRPIDNSDYNQRISAAVRPVGDIGVSSAQLPKSSFNDEDDFDNGILGRAVVRPANRNSFIHQYIPTHTQTAPNVRPIENDGDAAINVRPSIDNGVGVINRGILGASSTNGADGRAAVRPVENVDYNRRISSVRPVGDVGGSVIPLRKFDDDDDFDNGILGHAVIRPGLKQDITSNNNQQISSAPSSGSLGGSTIQVRPSFSDDHDDDDFNRGFLGPAVRRPTTGGVAIRPNIGTYNRIAQNTFNDDNSFGSAPVFSEGSNRNSGFAGYGTVYPNHGFNYGSGNTFATGFNSGVGGYGNPNWYGGGFAGRFGVGFGNGGSGGGFGSGGTGGGGSGGGGDSEENDFDDDNDNGASGGGGFGSGGFGSGGFGGVGGPVNNFVGGGQGTFGGIQGYQTGYNVHNTYPKTHKNSNY